jgi:hypothetical protein
MSALEPRIVGQPLRHVRLLNAFLLRTAEPPITTDIGGIGGSLPTGRAGGSPKKVAANALRDFWQGVTDHVMLRIDDWTSTI